MFAKFAPIALLAAGAVLPGCLIVSGHESTISGAYVANEDLFNVEPGETTQADVRRTLGPPTSRAESDDGSERWTYRWKEEKESGGAVFLIFAAGSEKTIVTEVTITFRDGVVEYVDRG